MCINFSSSYLEKETAFCLHQCLYFLLLSFECGHSLKLADDTPLRYVSLYGLIMCHLHVWTTYETSDDSATYRWAEDDDGNDDNVKENQYTNVHYPTPSNPFFAAKAIIRQISHIVCNWAGLTAKTNRKIKKEIKFSISGNC